MSSRPHKQNVTFGEIFNEIFSLCDSIEKHYNRRNVGESKDSIEYKNLLSYKEIWNHSDNNPDLHQRWIKELFISNKKAILKNKDIWLRDQDKENVIIYGGKSNIRELYKINLFYFYKKANNIAQKVKKEEEEENEASGFEEVKLPMRHCNVKIKYWIYRCFMFVAEGKDQKKIKQQIVQLTSILGIKSARSIKAESMAGILKMAKSIAGTNNLSGISRSVLKDLKEKNIDASNPEHIGDAITSAVKCEGFSNMVKKIARNAKDSDMMDQVEQITKEFAPEDIEESGIIEFDDNESSNNTEISKDVDEDGPKGVTEDEPKSVTEDGPKSVTEDGSKSTTEDGPKDVEIPNKNEFELIEITTKDGPKGATEIESN
uniref:Uncharacterized protein n=1 Tax=Pithovirus LCPAC403 TaxID=2506596 RepID=A0A481ZD37_9VIRU|nr:MAG: hypothetical protein LCPAC403_01840 [Pithovirus LCPAC403]